MQFFLKQLSDTLLKLTGNHLNKEAWQHIDVTTDRNARSINIDDADSNEERRRKWISHFRKLLCPELVSSGKTVGYNMYFGI